MIDELRKIADELLIVNKNTKEYKKYELIKKILDDRKCFFKMDIKTSFALLRDLKINENDIEKVYKQLVNYKNF